MEFYEWQSIYSVMKKTRKRLKHATPREVYGEARKFFELRKDWPSIDAVQAEEKWYCNGNPYYKIWPSMCSALANINIDIDCKHFHLPFTTYEIRFPKDPPISEAPDSPILRSLLVYKSLNPPAKRDQREWTFVVHYQFDLDGANEDIWMGYYYSMPIKSGETIEGNFLRVLGESRYYNTGYIPQPGFVHQLIRIAVGTAFFGTHRHEMIMPDIPKRYVERYQKARDQGDEKEQELLEKRAKDLKHYGWHVGREIDLPRPGVKQVQQEPIAGRHLSFGHVRSGHMRMQPYGSKDDRRYELIFISPMMIRPDLPFRPKQGYRLKDSVLEAK